MGQKEKRKKLRRKIDKTLYKILDNHPKCSTCICFRHDNRAKRDGNASINWCTLDDVSQYRKNRLAFGDDLPGCSNHRTELEDRFDKKGW